MENVNSNVSSIDDVLMGAQSQVADIATSNDVTDSDDNQSYETDVSDSTYDTDSSDESHQESEPQDVDDYGNPKAKPRTYTEEEHRELLNKAVRERLDRLERNNPQLSEQIQQQQQAQAGFQYDANSGENWESQLESFIESTFDKVQQKKIAKEAQMREARIQEEFQDKFQQSMSKFPDFREVVSNMPITDAMTMATRSMQDPAAFIYAASKRNPQELQRIAAIPDPYSQMVEIGRLEERMRKSKTATNTPKPLGGLKEDGVMDYKKDRPNTGDDLIAKADYERKQRLIKMSRR